MPVNMTFEEHRPALPQSNITLANGEPSTHGASGPTFDAVGARSEVPRNPSQAGLLS